MTHQLPSIVIILGVESEPSVYRYGNASERERLADWLVHRRDLSDLIAWSFGWRGGESRLAAARREEPDDAEPDEDELEMGALLFTSYSYWPNLSLRDLQPADGEWLAENGVEIEGGRVTGWDAERHPYAEDVDDTDDPLFRPGPSFPPSIAEIRERSE